MGDIALCVGMGEYLSGSLDEAIRTEGVRISDQVKAYVLLLLRAQMNGSPWPAEPVSPTLAAALEASLNPAVRRERFRAVGDACLVSCGLWWMWLEERPRRATNLDFYLATGPMAYRQLRPEPVFDHLARTFGLLVDVLVRMHMTGSRDSARDIIRLFRIWERTRSGHAARLLAAQGINVHATAHSTPS